MIKDNLAEDWTLKIQENEESDKYLDLASDRKNLWNMKVTVISIVIGALGTVPKTLVRGLGELEMGAARLSKALLKSAKILRRVLET